MRIIKRYLSKLTALCFIIQSMTAFSSAISQPVMTAQPTSCIHSNFSTTGDQHWKTVTLTLTNNCDTNVDFEDTTVTFKNKSPLQTNFWGDFTPLPYPDSSLNITSQPQVDGTYLAAINMHFPLYTGVSTSLPIGKSIKIIYGTNSDTHIDESANVYVKGTPVESGKIELKNVSVKPSNVTQNYALIRLTVNGSTVSEIELPWNKTALIAHLAPATYTISPQTISTADGSYEGQATPSSVTVNANQQATSVISYKFAHQDGQIIINATLPAALSGYTSEPTILIKDSQSEGTIAQTVGWNKNTTVNQLKMNGTYSFSTDTIKYRGIQCIPTFNPASVTVSTLPTTTSLTYKCVEDTEASVNLKVTGAPQTLSSIELMLTPNDNSAPLKSVIDLNNGSGNKTIPLTSGVIYTVSSECVDGYAIKISPQPLTATPNATVSITLTKKAKSTPVAINGQLHVCGTKLCNQDNEPIQLKGMSSHGIQWFGNCMRPEALDTLAYEFKSSVVRIAMYVQEDGYETNPTKFTQEVSKLIDDITARGMYVIVDWHILTPGDPNYNLELAKKFFTDIATKYKDNNNIIYEIANEPNGVTWESIRNYANQIIPVIRAIDSNAPILVGTRGWSSLGLSAGSNYQEIVNNPINFPNIMYSFHFYAASHGDYYLNSFDEASSILPVFVTEFGTQTYSGDGANDFVMADRFLTLMASKKIGWANWNQSDDYRSGSIWVVGTCSKNAWTDNLLKPAGVYIKSKILMP